MRRRDNRNLFVRRLDTSDLALRGRGLVDDSVRVVRQRFDHVLERPSQVMSPIVVHPHPEPANQGHALSAGLVPDWRPASGKPRMMTGVCASARGGRSAIREFTSSPTQ
jgi:hypothetical protein